MGTRRIAVAVLSFLTMAFSYSGFSEENQSSKSYRSELTRPAGAYSPSSVVETKVNERPSALTAAEIATILVETPTITDVALAPNGNSVIYSVSRNSVEQNDSVSEFFLQSLGAGGAPHGEPTRVELPKCTSLAWLPDSKRISMILRADPKSPEQPTGFAIYDVEKRTFASVPLYDGVDRNGVAAKRPTITAISGGYRWSNDGRFVAFSAPIEFEQSLNPRAGVLATANQQKPGVPGARMGLFVLDPVTGTLDQVTPASLSVLHDMFDWSPDGQSLVVSAALDSDSLTTDLDLFVLDRSKGNVRRLVTQRGTDAFPSWSPNGEWIAFSSQFDEPEDGNGKWPALVPAAGGTVLRMGTREDTGGGNGAWLPDSSGYLYRTTRHMLMQVVKADVGSRSVTPISIDENRYEGDFSLSGDGRFLVFTRDSVSVPQELFIQELASGAMRQVTHLSSKYPLTELVQVDHINWPSTDGTFTIHGLLVTPRTAWAGKGPKRRITASLPTLVYHFGGPGMVRDSFGREGQGGAILAMAARGYVVLAPVTRGRPGYGESFDRALRDSATYVALPHEDAMAGIELLIKRRIADPERLGVYGHSYGGTLTAYQITQTSRFRAAVVHEGAAEVLTWATGTSAPGTDWALVARGLGFGAQDPFDPAAQARLLSESPLFNMARVQTPTLMQYGAGKPGSGGVASTWGRYLYGALQWSGAPSQFRIYDEGHVFTRPAAIADDLTRTAEWFDYWIRDMPYSDAERVKEYDAWKQERRNAPR